MKHLLWPLLLATALSGCATSVSPITGSVYSNVKAPLLALTVMKNQPKLARYSAFTRCSAANFGWFFITVSG